MVVAIGDDPSLTSGPGHGHEDQVNGRGRGELHGTTKITRCAYTLDNRLYTFGNMGQYTQMYISYVNTDYQNTAMCIPDVLQCMYGVQMYIPQCTGIYIW